MSLPVLQVKGLDKSYIGVHALDHVDFDLNEMEIHALLGENGAGKSTFMKILDGSVIKDGGRIFINGQEVNITNPHQAQQLGIGMVYQELSLIPNLTVAENIFLGRWPRRKLFKSVDWRQIYRQSKEALKRLGVSIDVKERVNNLGMGERQLTEIARAISMNVKILLLDEPTSALSDEERERLFAMVRALKETGVSIIYVSHRLSEVPQICDRVTVLRDGKKIDTLPVNQADESTLIRMMVGRNIGERFPKEKIQEGKEILRVKNLTINGRLNNLDLNLHQGEVLGIFGIMGAGRTEFARALFGIDKINKGDIFISGKRVNISSPENAIREGLGYLTEDRQSGLLMRMTIPQNITLPSLKRFNKFGFLRHGDERKIARDYIENLGIHTPKLDQKVEFLSGGNQQKVALAKWLCSQSKILILDEPTRGIDVGAKIEVYRLINELSKCGVGIILLSSELPEVLNMSDRILVMSDGSFVGEFKGGEASQEDLLRSTVTKK
ncbi:MAG: sugar ABC transporter ATP-binding protein [Candidatus Hydromicrobium sp.]|nr:sugar ABC transporter ATP-binding protein [Candidatus Hydromicrobium sp.]